MTGTFEQLKLALKPLGEPLEYREQLKVDCPVCFKSGVGVGKTNLEISFPKNAVHCWCCNYSGSIWKLINEHGRKEYLSLFGGDKSFCSEEDKEKREIPFELPKHIFNVLNDFKSTIYLLSRGLTKGKIRERQIKYCYFGKYKGAIIFPSYNKKEELTAYVIHFPEQKKYLTFKNTNFVCFYEDFIDKTSPIILVEGVYDALVSPNSIPMLGTSISTELATFLANTIIIYIPDNDVLVPVKKTAIKILLSVCKNVYLYKLLRPYKDVNEIYVKNKLVLVNSLKQFYTYER